MKILHICLAGALTVGAVACGSSSSSTDAGTTDAGSTDAGSTDAGSGDAGTAIDITVSGIAASFPINAAVAQVSGNAVDFTNLAIAVANPETVIADPNAAPLAGGALNTASSNCVNGACAWSFASVDISQVNLGLVSVIQDLRTSNPKWIKTGTGLASAATIAQLKASPAPLTGVKAFALTVDTEAALVQFVDAVRGNTALMPGNLVQGGFLVGSVVGNMSESFAPIAGATVASSNNTVDIYYPNATLTGAGTATSATGLFIAVPKVGTSGAVISSWTVTPPAGDTTHTWTAATAGVNPGSAFILLDAAN